MHSILNTRVSFLAAVFLWALHPIASFGAETKQSDISYYRDIRPIFQASCQGCHQPAKAKGGYVMTAFDRLLKGGDQADKHQAIVPGKPAKSLLVSLITPKDGEAEMPMKADPLPKEDINKISRWIAQGAKDDTPKNAKERYDMDNPPVYSKPPIVTSIDFSPDGKLIAVAGFHEVLVHSTEGSGLIARLVGLSARIESVKFSPNGKKLAVTGGLPARMGEVQVWDINKRALDLSVPVTYDTVYGASWSPDGKTIAFGCSDSTIRAIDAKTGKQVLYQGSHSDWVLDTVFSKEGTHVVSVGRDQTAKITELATQRFIDNLTSITPGALSGGILAVARHPSRDQVLVGGADGTPQVFRMFRKTKRVIGDNANLVKRFPPMSGRVFSVAYNPNGKMIAAGSSLDGNGSVNLYSADFTGELSEEMIKIFNKRINERSAEDKKKVQAFQNAGVSILSSQQFPAAIYALAFSPDGKTLAASGSDGVVRMINTASGGLERAFIAAPLKGKALEEIIAVTSFPSKVNLNGKFSYNQLLITGFKASGETIDLSHKATYKISTDSASVADSGKVLAQKNGSAVLSISWKNHQLSVPVKVEGVTSDFDPDYVTDIMPVVSRMGCNMGTCHGAKDGKNGFKLSLRGYDPIYDVRAFTDDLAGRRINFASPDDSLILLKGTGAVPHEGGARTKIGSDYYQTLRAWIAGGAKLNLDSPRVSGIEIFPKNPVVQSISDAQQVRIVATYQDGRKRDVTTEAFIDSGNNEVVISEDGGMLKAVRRGEAPILARFEGNYAATTMTVMGDRSGFEWKDQPANNQIDTFAAEKWQRMKILPSNICSDSEFIRRIYLDLIGLPPSAEEVIAFTSDKTPSKEKRNKLIDKLIGNDDYIELWANKWSDLLQVNRKFLGAEGAGEFRKWIRAQVAENTPYDQFAKTILTASGSNKANPPASYYKILRTPEDTMENTTHLFLATRFNCNKCHDHPFERWTQDQYYQLSAYFAQVGYKPAAEAKGKKIAGTAVEGAKPLYEEIFDTGKGDIKHERTGAITPPVFPYPVAHKKNDKNTRRESLAEWMTSPNNPLFAKSYVNRIWGYLTGTGIIEPIDDIRAGNPASNPELLDWLTEDFIKSGFDTRHLIRTICQSRVYQLSVKTHKWNEDDQVNFSHAKARRLPAEVLFDAIYTVTGSKSKFPGVPEGTRACALPDSGIKLPDGFLNNLGRPPRESSCECERANELQLGSIMALVSGPTVDQALSQKANAIEQLAKSDKTDEEIVKSLFLRVLNRPASKKEIDSSLKMFKSVKTDHQTLTKELAAYEKKLKPITKEKEADRSKRITEAKAALEEYQAEIAPAEAEKDKMQKEAIAKAEKALKAYEATLADKLIKWEAKPTLTTTWEPLKLTYLKSKAGAKLTQADDLSVTASGKKALDVYSVAGNTKLQNITGIKLEALTGEGLPKTGPGRAKDGNFVLSEFSVDISSSKNTKKRTRLQLHKAKASFSQSNYAVATAIDGKAPGNGNGWAISPQGGRDQQAIFSVKKPTGGKAGSQLLFTLNQNFRSKEHLLGKFRLSVTTDKGEIDFGITPEIKTILATKKESRTEEQSKSLLAFFRNMDRELDKKTAALAEAKKKRPELPKLTELKAKLKRAEMPLPIDPKLKDLQRALKLSTAQIETVRLTAAQDVAWALINNPAFLFNH